MRERSRRSFLEAIAGLGGPDQTMTAARLASASTSESAASCTVGWKNSITDYCYQPETSQNEIYG
jgi:hypothetical protein